MKWILDRITPKCNILSQKVKKNSVEGQPHPITIAYNNCVLLRRLDTRAFGVDLCPISKSWIRPWPEIGAINSTIDSGARVIPPGVKFYQRLLLDSNRNRSISVTETGTNGLL